MLTRQWFLAFVCTARTKIIAHVKGPKTAFRYEKAQRPGAVSLLINWCIEPSQPQMIKNQGKKNNVQSVSYLLCTQVIKPQTIHKPQNQSRHKFT